MGQKTLKNKRRLFRRELMFQASKIDESITGMVDQAKKQELYTFRAFVNSRPLHARLILAWHILIKQF